MTKWNTLRRSNAAARGQHRGEPEFDALDRQAMNCQSMSMSSAVAVTKLQNLSQERANKVFALIEDLAELDALENADDLKDARNALAESSPTIPYEQLRREVGLDR